ncbi:MAG: acyl-CoA dehydrogenase, partial [Caproiciproducens sp.]|nr:acyl-CoA dehydrogenase [Caproiciproducens sp.]
MDFKLTAEQELLKDTIRKFAEAKIEPISFQLDTDNAFPEKIVKELG